MSSAFEILLPASDALLPFEFTLSKFKWESVEYPQGLPEAKFYSFILRRTPVPSYVIKYLPSCFEDIVWQCLMITGEGLDNLIRESDSKESDFEEVKLKELLNLILGYKEKWVLFCEPDYDIIIDIGTGSIEKSLNKIKTSLSNRTSFILWNWP